MKQAQDGECEERNYIDGKLQGEATVIYPDSSKEMRNYAVSFKIRKKMSTIKCGTGPPSCAAMVVLFYICFSIPPITERDGNCIAQELTERYSKENRPCRAH